VMEWMATITGDHVGKEKNLGEQKFPRLSASNFCGRINSLISVF